MSKFKIGDIVEIIPDSNGRCPYNFTTIGSVGVILKTSIVDEEVYVKWNFLPNFPHMQGETYHVQTKHIKLIQTADEELPEPDRKYSKIIHKMRKMEAKRKQLGYKTYEKA